MQFDRIELGNRIYTARKNKDMTQLEVCLALGISQSTYSKLEYGNYDMPVSVLHKLSVVLDVPMAWLLGNENSKFTHSELLEIEKFKRYLISQRKRKK